MRAPAIEGPGDPFPLDPVVEVHRNVILMVIHDRGKRRKVVLSPDQARRLAGYLDSAADGATLGATA